MVASSAYYSTPPTELRGLGLVATGAGRIIGQRSSRIERTLPCYAGVLVIEGAGTLTLRGRPGVHEVWAGSFFWLPPWIPHTYGPTPASWSEYWVLFEGPAASCYEDLGYLGGGPSVSEPEDPKATRELMVRLLELGSQPESLARHVAASTAVQALICAVGTTGTTDPKRNPAGSGRRDIGRRALELLAADTDRPVSIGAVARELEVSRDTLATAVRELTGSTPTNFLTRQRLNRAKMLLAETDLTVAQVARTVGYDDPAYFTRVFTRNIGVPPREFRQQQKS